MTAEGTLGTRLKALREGAGLSQRALARLAGTDSETIGRWEAGGTPRAGTLRKVAAALGVPPDALAGGSGAVGVEPTAGGLPPALHAALVDRGVLPGPAGYDVATLVAAIAARGWRAVVEERASRRCGRFRYHAMVFGSVGGNYPMHVNARARGDTEAEALAKALVRLLERTG